MKKFSEQVLAPHKHMAKKASPYHAHSMGVVYTPKGKEEVRPIDTADAGYGGEAVADGEGGEANAGRASKKAVPPMKMQTLVKTNEGFDPSPSDIAKELVKKHGKNVTKAHIRDYEQDRDSHRGLDHDEIMQHVKKLQEETERERLMKLRSFAAQQRRKGLGKVVVEQEQIDEVNKKQIQKDLDSGMSHDAVIGKHANKKLTNTDEIRKVIKQHAWDKRMKKEEIEQIDELKNKTLASYAKKATDDVSYHSFMAGNLDAKDPQRLAHDKIAMKRQSGVIKAVNKLVKEDGERIDEVTQGKEYTKKQLEDKIKAGNWQTTYDIKPGKHVELTHTSGKKVSVMVKEDVELDERIQANKEKWKTKLRTVGVNAAIQHPKKVQFGGGALQMGRDALKKLSSKEVSDAARKLPKVNEVNDWNGPAEENDMAMTQLHFIVYAAEEIMHAIKVGTDMEEWYQNKLSKVHSDMESLHSYMEGTKRHHGSLGDPVAEGKMKDIATGREEEERLKAREVLGGEVRKKPEGPKGKLPLGYRLARSAAKKAMKSVSEEQKKSKVPRVGPMDGVVEEEVWDKPMPDSKKQGSLSPEQKAKAKARAARAGRSYPNMIDNMWASKQ